MTLFFVTVYSELRAVRARRVRRWLWHLLGVLSLVTSVLAYEVMIPLFALTPLLVWYHLDRGKANRKSAPAVSAAALLVAIVPALVFKMRTSARMGALPLREHVRWFDKLIADAAATSFGDYGLRLPILLGNIWQAGATGASFAVGVLTALIAFGYLMHTDRFEKRPLPGLAASTATAVGGAVLFVLGLAIFATNTNAQISGAGISNRVMIAAALGVSVCFVAFAAALALAFRNQLWQPRVFCALIAFIAGAQCAMLNGIAWHWVRAYEEAQNVLSAFQRQLPEVLPEASIIGDGFCPYVGPAIVFESSWDLTGALRVLYDVPDLRANVVTPNLRVEEDGLLASLYSGGMMDRYPYERVIIHNVTRGITVPIPAADAAHAYFARYNPDRTGGCPPGRAGTGVSIF
jgi:hypothetical protein